MSRPRCGACSQMYRRIIYYKRRQALRCACKAAVNGHGRADVIGEATGMEAVKGRARQRVS